MSIKSNQQYLAEHSVFSRLKEEDLAFLAQNSDTRSVDAEEVIFRDGESANAFFIVLQGQVELYTNTSGNTPTAVQTLDSDEIVGLSWIIAPYTWGFEARGGKLGAILMELDAKAIRARCEQDPVFGYGTMRRVSELMLKRLHAVRSQMAERIHELENKGLDRRAD